MRAIEEKLKSWLENNRLDGTNLYHIKTLAKQRKLRIQETIHRGYEAIFLTSGLETYKIVVNTDQCKLNVLSKNMTGNMKNQYHHVKDFTGADSWIDAIWFVGEIIQRKRRECSCLGKRYYRKSGEYG